MVRVMIHVEWNVPIWKKLQLILLQLRQKVQILDHSIHLNQVSPIHRTLQEVQLVLSPVIRKERRLILRATQKTLPRNRKNMIKKYMMNQNVVKKKRKIVLGSIMNICNKNSVRKLRRRRRLSD